MERMWRKVNQGFTSLSKTAPHSTDTASSAGFGEVPKVAAVSSSSMTGGIALVTEYQQSQQQHQSRAHKNSRRQNHQSSSSAMGNMMMSNTASSERRRRRRKRSRPRREGQSSHHPIGMINLPVNHTNAPPIVPPTSTLPHTDTSLKQRAVAKLKLFNFHLNWDLHMTQCKPCGPRSSGNILTRRLCRNRRNREDNELYRSNSFKFERFERKDEFGTESLRKKISVCDDYSLPVDFVKKRPSSFDPCLAERLPDNWASPSPLSEHVTFLDSTQPLAATTLPTSVATNNPTHIVEPLIQQTAIQQQPLAKPVPSTINHHHSNLISFTPIKLVEGYSDPKDTKQKKHRRKSRECSKESTATRRASLSKPRDYSHLYSSDSSAPKSSADEFDAELGGDRNSQVPELNSPDSITDDLVKPLPTLQSHKSPKRLSTSETNNFLTISSTATTSKRNPSPYYYSDLLKNKEQQEDPKTNSNSRPTLSSNFVKYRKSNSLDTPIPEKEIETTVPKRYSITEEGVRIIRCDSPSTTTSEDSDCTECQKRREWHAKALALVRDSCNIVPRYSPNSMPPHRLLGPAVCACAAPEFGDDQDELFRPRSIFYVHQQGADECADCTLRTSTTTTTATNTFSGADSNKFCDGIGSADIDDEMSGGNKSGGSSGGGRTRQIYETAFDCKILKSDDDLDDVDRLASQNQPAILLQLNTSISNSSGLSKMSKSKSNNKLMSRSAKQKQSAESLISSGQQHPIKMPVTASKSDGSASTLSQELENMHLNNNANTVSSSQLPLRGYTPSPPSTAPLPVKFPAKHHDRYFFMNSIKSAPNLPSSQQQITSASSQNSTTALQQSKDAAAQHPRLRELRNPIVGNDPNAIPVVPNRNTQNLSIIVDDNPVSDGIVECESPSYNNCPRPRSVVLESSRVLELKRNHHHHNKIINHHHTRSSVGGGGGAGGAAGRKNYSSTESMATSSSGGSMESLRSSTSEGNRSTSSSESHHSNSLSSHSSDSGPSLSYPLRAPQLLIHSKLHILSPISDKSSQEPGSETSDINNRNNNSQKVSPDEIITTMTTTKNTTEEIVDNAKGGRKRMPQNKNLILIKGDEIQGSDSGISLQSRDDTKSRSAFQQFGGFQKLGTTTTGDKNNKLDSNTNSTCLPQELNDLPFDMPKLRRRKIIPQQDACTSGSATSVDLGELPFDMPKLRRRLRLSQPTSQTTQAIIHHTSTESSGISHASSSQSVREDKLNLGPPMFRQNLTLNLGDMKAPRKFGTLEFGTSRGLNLNVGGGGGGGNVGVDLIDASIPLDRQGWYHGAISRIEAENTLRPLSEGSFLVRNSESTKQDYSLSLKSAKGFMHMRIQKSNDTGQYILGQFSRPFDTIPDMIRHFCLNRLPVRGAEHMCLLEPVIAQLL